MRTTLTWLNRAIARASRNDRSRISCRSAPVSPTGGTSSLIATSRPSTSSRARQTRPMPPSPSGAKRRYRSAMRAGSIDMVAPKVPVSGPRGTRSLCGMDETAEPAFRVVRGVPTDEELAALVGVLLWARVPAVAPASGSAAAAAWALSARPAPAGLRAGVGAWRASGLPR
jgi:hypothetical protein